MVLIRSLQQLDVFLKLNKALGFSALGTVASPDNITSYSGADRFAKTDSGFRVVTQEVEYK